ncbi:hypothetical protein ACIPRD_25335 [Streptomyces sp. NPDC090108]|uniref:hypothetical protein n=1 Tax=Streptomyces sp. NPDC090108 TaxID=3365947 RepID=UPI0038248B57
MFRRRRADELALIDADITAFGEELARHTFVPTRQDSDELVFADYERALDAYERAKRDFVGDRDREDAQDVLHALAEGRHALACAEARAAGRPLPARRPVPGLAPAPMNRTDLTAQAYSADPRPARGATPPPGKGAHWRPYKIWPPGTPTGQRAEATGYQMVELVRPDPEQPALLVVRMDAGGSAQLLGHEGMRHLIKRGSNARRTILPLPANGFGTVRVKVAGHGPWRVWLQSLDEHVPVLESKLNSRGPYVFRYLGGPATIRATQNNGGTFWLEELTDDGEPGQRLIAGKGTCNGKGRLNGPALIRVQSSADWTVTLAQGIWRN